MLSLPLKASNTSKSVWGDLDLVAVKGEIPKTVISCKTSLHGRFTETLFWSLLFRMLTRIKVVLATSDARSGEVVDIDKEQIWERQSTVIKAGEDSKMKRQKFNPPKCSACEKPLWVVYEHEYWSYGFDERTGTYKGNLDVVEIRCPDCNAKLYDVFPEGACNYRAL